MATRKSKTEAADTQYVWNGNPVHLNGRILFAGEVLGEEDVANFGDTWEAEVQAGRLQERPKGPAAEGMVYVEPQGMQNVGSTQGGGVDPTRATSPGPGSSGNETVPSGGPGGAAATPQPPDAVPTEPNRDPLPEDLSAADLEAEAKFREAHPGELKDSDVPAGWTPDALRAEAAARRSAKSGGGKSD